MTSKTILVSNDTNEQDFCGVTCIVKYPSFNKPRKNDLLLEGPRDLFYLALTIHAVAVWVEYEVVYHSTRKQAFNPRFFRGLLPEVRLSLNTCDVSTDADVDFES